jgi:endonuclease/exonuclease/phosphatase family metal-dependent hydrolase
MTQSLRVVTLNIHKGLSQFNRRMVIHELREGLNTLAPDLVFLQEVQGLNERHAVRFPSWPSTPQHEFLAPADWHHAYGRNREHHHGHYGNAILSRFRILSTEHEDVSDHRFERRGLLHCVVAVPGWRRNLHCVCVHLSLHERGRRRQLDALVARLEALAGRDLPILVAGDFNDWRQRATAVLAKRLAMTEVSAVYGKRHARTFPSLIPFLRLDRIYVRGFNVVETVVHRGPPWSLLSDHLALGALLKPL